MRLIKRWWRQVWGDMRIRKRRDEITSLLQAYLNLADENIRLLPKGARGNDSVYLVSHADKILGVMRLSNSYRQRKLPSLHMPYVLLDTAQRIEREWTAYTKGAPYGLTPQPIWRTHDALLNEYLPYETLQAKLEKTPDEAWSILSRAARRLHQLHEREITHMDACLANILEDPREERICFIDYEYAPAPHVPPGAQRVYDHLRLVDSAWKFIPDMKKTHFDDWLDYFSGCMDEEMRHADLSLLEPALTRVLSASALGPKIRQLFQSASLPAPEKQSA